MRRFSPRLSALLLFWALLVAAPLLARAQEAPPLASFTAGDAYLLVEFLDDDLVRFESGTGAPPAAIGASPMVAKTDYPGPTSFTNDGAGILSTAELQVIVDPQTLCSTVLDISSGTMRELTAVCPTDLDARKSSLTIDPGTSRHVYGLGEKFRTPGEPNGDWLGKEREIGIFGNVMEGFNGGAVGNAQFPVLYALGAGKENHALFVDGVYKQEWELVGDSWTMTSSADPLRWYILGGPDLTDLRADYMELTGRPPVPPLPFHGLWISEYGYDNWAELDEKRETLDAARFPQDGFVLDLQWFGGIRPPSQMGSLSWDLENFPDPAAKIDQLAAEEGLDIVLIEESYIDDDMQNFGLMASQSFLVKECATCGPATMRAWWGTGGMVDWTNSAAAAFWHDNMRQPLIDAGIIGHWTDLGEPEMAAPNSWFAGLPGLELHDQLANHNIYNLLWAQSIFDGYARNDVAQRPAILSRSGTSGIQRYGAAMWSGDIGANFDSLAAHMNAQMHMSFSGVDYFGSDIGGFHRGEVDGAELDELYTVWFANSALLDLPVRPHTENLCNCKETAPDRVGDTAANLANIRLRYRLAPYLYSLAHAAYRTGAPVVPPLLFYYQDDLATRPLGDHKLLGRDILVRTVTAPGITEIPVYLPAGSWVNFHTGEWVASGGEWVDGVSTQPAGLFQLPLFVRAGAIIPLLHVDEQTMNLSGMRRDGSTRDELIIYVVPAPEATNFTLYEDDGRTTAYQHGELRQTDISQQWVGQQINVEIAAAAGSFAGANTTRDNQLQLMLGAAEATAVLLDGEPLPVLPSRAAWEAAHAGWYAADGVLRAKSGPQPVADAKQFTIELVEAAPAEIESADPPPAAAPAPAAAADAERDDAETAASANSQGWLLLGISLAILLLVKVGGWLYLRRRRRS